MRSFMKKLLIASAALASTFAFTACGDDSSSGGKPDDCSKLNKACFQGTWEFKGFDDASGSEGYGSLVFKSSEFEYIPEEQDTKHTICPNKTFKGTYELDPEADKIIFTIKGFKTGSACFPDGINGVEIDYADSKSANYKYILTASAEMNQEGTELTIEASEQSIFVPSDENGKIEVYTKQ